MHITTPGTIHPTTTGHTSRIILRVDPKKGIADLSTSCVVEARLIRSYCTALAAASNAYHQGAHAAI